MQKCDKCKKILLKDSKYCPNCGNELEVKKIVKPTKAKEKESDNPYKCIHCGADYKAFSCICPYCGKDQIGQTRSKSIIEFANQLKKYEDSKSKSAIGALVSGKKNANIEEQKRNYIKTFVVPNSKEDVLEFMVLATSNIDPMVMLAKNAAEVQLKEKEFQKQKAESLAWNAKMEQVYQKAVAAFGVDEDFVVIKRLYDRTQKAISKILEKKAAEKRKLTIIGVAAGAFLFITIALGALFGDNDENTVAEVDTIIESQEEAANDYEVDEEISRMIISDDEDVELQEESVVNEIADLEQNNEVQVENEVVEEKYTYTELYETKYAQNKVNVRDLPDKTGNVVGSLVKNDEIEVTGKCNETGWYRIAYANSVAYVSDTLVGERIVEVQVEETKEIPSAKNKVVEEKPVIETPPPVVEQPPVVETPASGGTMVYIAPESGEKYHYKSTCRGLKKANSIVQVSIEEARAMGRTLCGYED